MQKFLIQFAITFGLILGGQAAHAAQDACFDLTNCPEDSGFNSGNDNPDYLEYLRNNFGIGIDTGGVCLDGTCNMPREECQQYCDDLHDDLMDGCSGLTTRYARRICREQAMQEYGRCLARCP